MGGDDLLHGKIGKDRSDLSAAAAAAAAAEDQLLLQLQQETERHFPDQRRPMPKQTRGFWTCDYCGTTFDRLEEARYHEVEECERVLGHRPPPPLPSYYPAAAGAGGAMLAYPPPPSHHHLPYLPPPPHLLPPSHYPISPLHETVAPEHTQQQQPVSQQQQQQQPHHQQQYAGGMAPYGETERFARLFEYASAIPPTKARRFPLLVEPKHDTDEEEEESAIDTSRLKEADIVACRNLELFEMDAQTTAAAASSRNTAAPAESTALPRSKQIGLRCLVCAAGLDSSTSSTRGGATTEYSLPRTILSLGDAVRRLADHHLSVCDKLNPQDRWILDQAARTRPKKQEGPALAEDERYRRALIEFCRERCQRLGMVDKYPENSGIEFIQRDDNHLEGTAADVFDESPIGTPQQMGKSGPKGAAGAPPLPPDAGGGGSSSSVGQYGPSRMGSGRFVEYGSSSPYLSLDPMDPRVGMMGMSPGSHLPPHHLAGPPPPHLAYYRGPQYDIPVNFPFFQDPNEGDWICKFCSHMHPQHRDFNYRWSSPGHAPPPAEFIDHHLSLCRAYHHSQMMTAPPQQQPPHTPMYGFSPVQSRGFAPASGWDTASDLRSPEALLGAMAASRDSPLPASASRSSFTDPAAAYHRSSGGQLSASAAAGGAIAMPPDPDREASILRAIEHLNANDKSIYLDDGSILPEDALLVREEDKLLLTDFLFYLMKQLRLVRFSESDRKTRGGKRERIQIGYGGLECVHCGHIKKSRKFFWSGVDRLANSFAEIPTHIFKCKYCPQPVKDALTQLKQLHSEQMARLPRGSQKVFFRRVWKRIHEDDPEATSPENPKPPPGQESSPGAAAKQESPSDTKHSSPSGGTSGSDESILFIDRPTKEAAKALADSAMQSEPPSPTSRILLAITEDRDFLSDTDCFIRRQLEVFCATKEDVRAAQDDRKFPVQEGQVGIRCIHCSLAKGGPGARGHAVAYPFSVSGIFESVREFQRLHLEYCENLPPNVKSKLGNLKESTTITSIQRKYYTLAAKGLGLYDAKDGIRAGSESVPVVSQAVFSFPEAVAVSTTLEDDSTASAEPSPRVSTELPHLRQSSQSSDRTVPTSHSRKRSGRPDQKGSPKKPATPENRSSYPSRYGPS